MSIRILVVFTAALVVVAYEINAVPVGSWHKIAKRDTTKAGAKIPPTSGGNKSESDEDKGREKLEKNNEDTKNDQGDELIDLESFSAVDPASEPAEPAVLEEESDSSPERSIDWQLLSGNPEDLQQELETRRRRRSVRSAPSLARQHRIRMTAGGGGRSSRAKRNVYGYGDDGDASDRTLDPADLLAAYEYLQARRQEELLRGQQLQQQPQISLLDPNDDDNLANLAYELQQQQQERSYPSADAFDIQDQQEPYEYLALQQQQQPEILITPDQLAALELALSEQQQLQRNDDDDEEPIDYYPKDKRSPVIDYSSQPAMIYGENDQQRGDEEDGEDDGQEGMYEPNAIYLIPANAAAEEILPYVDSYPRNAPSSAYNFYQIDGDDDPRPSNEDAERLYQEEQLRRRIASLVDEINQQRRIDNRRRRRR